MTSILGEFDMDEYKEFIKEEYKQIYSEEGRAKGLAEGRAEGLAEGLAEGRAEGQKDLLIELAKANQLDVAIAAERAHIPLEEFEKMLQ